jgi:hypothetical protein
MRRRCASFLTSLIATALLACAPAHGAQLFAPDSVWNAPLPGEAPIAAGSADVVAELQRQVDSAGVWINTRRYSVPIYTVPADQPVVHVQLDGSYPPLQSDIEAVPLPPDAVPAVGSDGHLAIHQPSTDTLWELWKASKAPDGWHARWGGRMTGVSISPGYFPAPMGATGTSLPLLGGLMRIDELQAGHIDHALALAIPGAKAGAYVWPAQRSDGSSTSPTAIVEGTRLRLDPDLDVAALRLPPLAEQMALAAQRYGIVIRDISGAVTFYGEDPTPTGTDPYPAIYGNRYPDQVLARFPWSRLEVVAAPGESTIDDATAARVSVPVPTPTPPAAPAATPAPAPAASDAAAVPASTVVGPSTLQAKSTRARPRCARRAKGHARRARLAKSRACRGTKKRQPAERHSPAARR